MLNLNTVNKEKFNASESMEDSYSPSLALAVLVIIFILFGLTMLYSTSSGTSATKEHVYWGITLSNDLIFFIKQTAWAFVGSSAAFFIFLIGYKKLTIFTYPMLIVAGIALIIALAFPATNGAHRWIKVKKLFSLQPSEFAKIAVIVYLSDFLSKKQRFFMRKQGLIELLKTIYPALLWCGAILALIIVGEDLGTTVLLATTIWVMFFIAGLRLRWLIIPPVLFGIPLGFYIYYFDNMRLNRILSFLNPEKVSATTGYQLWNSLLALGSGGWFGLGFTQSRMKARYLPEAHTDFILSIVGEELGFITILMVIIGYIAITSIGIWIAVRAKNKALMLLASGAVTLLAVQALINLGVVSGSLPTKGMPAPFISYGGSNMVMSLTCIGLLLMVEREKKNGSKAVYYE